MMVKNLPFLITCLILFIYTLDLRQVNPESLFLTVEGRDKFERFQEKFPDLPSIVVLKEFKSPEDRQEYDRALTVGRNMCKEGCELVEAKHETEGKRSLKLAGKDFQAFVIFKLEDEFQFTDLLDKMNGLDVKVVGHPYTNYLLDQYSEKIKTVIFPIMFLISFLVIVFLTKNIIDSLILFFPSIFSALMSMGILKFLYGSMNMVTSIIPLMGFVLTLALGQHLYFTIREYKNFSQAWEMKKKPVILMVATTFIGFLSLFVSQISVIKIFGVITAFVILVATCLSYFWYKLNAGYFHFQKESPIKKFQGYPESTLSLGHILIFSAMVLISGTYAFKEIRVVTDATEYFPEKTAIKANMDRVSGLVGGIPIIDIGLNLNKALDIEQAETLANIENEIEDETGLKVLSNNVLVSEINEIYAKENGIPKHFQPYLLLRSKLPESLKEIYSIGEPDYRMTILGKHINVSEYENILEKIRSILIKSNIKYEIDGLYYNLMISQKEMITTLFKSFFLSLLVIILIGFSVIRKGKLIFSFLIVNLLPIGLSFVFLYIFGMSLNIATVMTYSIALGMVVDSSFHMVHALDHTKIDFTSFLHSTVRPIITSTVVLILSFGLFAFYDFAPIKQFGLNLAFVLIVGMFFDLFVLPTLYLGHRRLKEAFNDAHI